MIEREVQARTVAGFCAAYGVGVTTTYALIGAGKLRTVKVGRRTLIVEASAREWFDGLSKSYPYSHPSSNVRVAAKNSEGRRIDKIGNSVK